MTATFHHCLGQMRTDPIAVLLNTGFERFDSPSGIHGLAKVRGDNLCLLAIMAHKPRTGQFRAFITECKKEFASITIVEIWNKDLPEVLTRYGFSWAHDAEFDEGMEWKR